MGNTKTYYIEGELLKGTTIEVLKEAIYDGFHSTYCVAEIVETTGGYLGTGPEDGPYAITAIHSYSMSGDNGPGRLFPLFKYFDMHRVDADWADCWIGHYDSRKEGKDQFKEWRAHDAKWVEVGE